MSVTPLSEILAAIDQSIARTDPFKATGADLDALCVLSGLVRAPGVTDAELRAAHARVEAEYIKIGVLSPQEVAASRFKPGDIDGLTIRECSELFVAYQREDQVVLKQHGFRKLTARQREVAQALWEVEIESRKLAAEILAQEQARPATVCDDDRWEP